MSKYLPPDAVFDDNFVRMLRVRLTASKVTPRVMALSMKLNEDYLRNLTGTYAHDKGIRKHVKAQF
jgi:hypothetical protein